MSRSLTEKTTEDVGSGTSLENRKLGSGRIGNIECGYNFSLFFMGFASGRENKYSASSEDSYLSCCGVALFPFAGSLSYIYFI